MTSYGYDRAIPHGPHCLLSCPAEGQCRQAGGCIHSSSTQALSNLNKKRITAVVNLSNSCASTLGALGQPSVAAPQSQILKEAFSTPFVFPCLR